MGKMVIILLPFAQKTETQRIAINLVETQCIASLRITNIAMRGDEYRDAMHCDKYRDAMHCVSTII